MTPRDAVELELTQLFEELLEVEGVGVTDDFFDLGGHSLLAARLVAKIGKRLGVTVPLAVLFEDTNERPATVEQISRLVRAGGAQRTGRPVALRRGGEAPPLFCVHPAGGDVVAFRDLARSLTPARTVWGLQAPPLVSGQEQSVPALASHHLGHIRDLQPHGPYYLAGWSMGGALALEMAARLHADGNAVHLLALLDSYPGDQLPEPDDTAILQAFAEELGLIFGAPVPLADGELPTLPYAQGVEHVLRRARETGVLPPDAEVSDLLERLHLYQAHVRALRDYTPTLRVDRLALVFAAEGDPAAQERAAMRWTGCVDGPVERLLTKGDHHTMLAEPHVRALADLLGELMAR